MLRSMRRIAAIVAFLLAAAPAGAQLSERIDVVRLLLDVRATGWDGTPVTDLTPDDFAVTIGGQRAEVESAEWIDDASGAVGSQPTDDSQPTEGSEYDRGAESAPLHGRLIVIFVQTDFTREKWRVQGHLHFLMYAKKMIDAFAPTDRVAVMQFDSHFKLRLDFTSDKRQILEALRDTVAIDEPEAAIVPEPSLRSRLDRTAMRRAADSETALLILGNALRPIAGPKTILLLGWGLGHLSAGFVKMSRNYGDAREALDASRSTIFALDTTDADYHDLEIGLQAAAEDTGGFYAKTHIFPQLAVDRLHRTLSGHYELELRRPHDLDPGTHDLRVRVKRRFVTVLAPTTYMDRH